MAIKQKTVKALREIPIEVRRLLEGSYPAFVTARTAKPVAGEVPVFVFHRVRTEVLNRQLEFLAGNGYRTLPLNTFMAFLAGEVELRQPSVLLTFDDGDVSWYRVAYPMLKQYGFQAVGFVVSSRLREHPDSSAQSGWLSWPEVQEMEQNGVMDLQSHTFRHGQVFVAADLVDFFHPQFHYDPLELYPPWIGEGEDDSNRLQWGTPIYRYESRFAGKLRFIDDVRVREECVSWVSMQGGEAFFGRSNWRQELIDCYQAFASKGTIGWHESEEQQREAILDDFIKARLALQEKLRKEVRHLCYPWGAGSELAVSLSKQAGYLSNFWVTTSRRNNNHRGDSPYYIPRLKDDYIFRLPGKGRKPLAEILIQKLRRRIQRLDIY